MTRIRASWFAAAVLALTGAPVLAQELPMEGPVSTSALINVESKSKVPLDPAQLKLEVNGRTTPIAQVQPVGTEPAQIAILIDDGLRGSFGLQLSQLGKFLTELPPSAGVMVGYMENGTVRKLQDEFTTEHEALASKLRIPLASAGISASPYFCLSDFVKHWPSTQPGPRFVLMITNGVDPYNGSTSITNQDSPYVQTAQEDAQRAGVAVYSIYFPDSGYRGGRGSFSGQSYLQQVGDATGARSFNIGSIPPVDITPYLNSFRSAIGESYVVRFQSNATREKSNTLTRIKLTTSQQGVKIHAPEGVHPGVAE
jgi:hypothetical protein